MATGTIGAAWDVVDGRLGVVPVGMAGIGAGAVPAATSTGPVPPLRNG